MKQCRSRIDNWVHESGCDELELVVIIGIEIYVIIVAYFEGLAVSLILEMMTTNLKIIGFNVLSL